MGWKAHIQRPNYCIILKNITIQMTIENERIIIFLSNKLKIKIIIKKLMIFNQCRLLNIDSYKRF